MISPDLPKSPPISTDLPRSPSQVVISLLGGEVVYFELDAQAMLAEMDKKDTGHEVRRISMLSCSPALLLISPS